MINPLLSIIATLVIGFIIIIKSFGKHTNVDDVEDVMKK